MGSAKCRFKQGKDLTKGSTWKDIIFEVFDKLLVLADGQVTPDEIIEAILDLGLGINFDDIKWIKRFLGFTNDAFKYTISQIDNALDFGSETINRMKHRMKHFQRHGLIPSTGNPDNNATLYKNLMKQIMQSNPVKTIKRNVRGQELLQFLHYHDGKPILVSIYNEGPFKGKLKQAIPVEESTIAQIMSLPDYTP